MVSEVPIPDPVVRRLETIEAMLAEFPPDVAERLKIMHATDEGRRSMSEIIAAYQAEMRDAD